MKFEAKLFLYGTLFFIPIGLLYGWWSGGEAVGTYGIPLVGGLSLMVGGYLWLVARRIDERPEDDPFGEIEQGAGELGTFAPWSWWPLIVAIASAMGFIAVAVGWWLMVPTAVITIVALVGWVMEYSRGIHAH